LANIRDRVEALHGRLTIESRLGAGTSVRAELPLSTSARGQ
jgi:signal transduction histidine kinase